MRELLARLNFMGFDFPQDAAQVAAPGSEPAPAAQPALPCALRSAVQSRAARSGQRCCICCYAAVHRALLALSSGNAWLPFWWGPSARHSPPPRPHWPTAQLTGPMLHFKVSQGCAPHPARCTSQLLHLSTRLTSRLPAARGGPGAQGCCDAGGLPAAPAACCADHSLVQLEPSSWAQGQRQRGHLTAALAAHAAHHAPDLSCAAARGDPGAQGCCDAGGLPAAHARLAQPAAAAGEQAPPVALYPGGAGLTLPEARRGEAAGKLQGSCSCACMPVGSAGSCQSLSQHATLHAAPCMSTLRLCLQCGPVRSQCLSWQPAGVRS